MPPPPLKKERSRTRIRLDKYGEPRKVADVK